MAELRQRFPVGQVMATPGALRTLEAKGMTYWQLLDRHVTGDWGNLSDDDKQANAEALTGGGRLLSSYTVGDGRVWIITEADRSATTLLLPDEY